MTQAHSSTTGPNHGNVSAELKAPPNWIIFEVYPDPTEDDPEHLGKTPRSPHGGKAKSDNPTTWASYGEARDAAKPGEYLGMALPEGYTGVDIDQAFTAQGELKPEAEAVLAQFAELSYVERSVSGRGLHAICKGQVPQQARKQYRLGNGVRLEIYSYRRFFVMTGDTYGPRVTTIGDGQQAIHTLIEQLKSEGNAQGPAGEPIRTGEQENTIMDWLGRLRRAGASDAVIRASAYAIGKQQCNPQVADRDLDRMIASACKWQAGERKQRPTSGPIVFRSVQDVLNKPPQEWAVAGWIVAGSLCMLYGPSSSYKSFIGLDIALSIALGRPWQGHATRHGAALYIAAEGIDGMRKRLLALAQHRNLDLSKARLFFVERAISFYDGTATTELTEIVASYEDPFTLLVVDTYSRNSVGAEENSNSDMVKVLNQVQEVASATGAAVLMIHHVAKATGGMRGASAVLNSVDSSLKAERDDCGHVKLTTDKQKDHDDSGAMTLEREIVTLPDGETSLVLTRVGNDQFVPSQRRGGEGAGKPYDRSLDGLKALCVAPPHEVPRGTWEGYCRDILQIARNTFERHRADLVKDGLVTFRTAGKANLYKPTVTKFEQGMQ